MFNTNLKNIIVGCLVLISTSAGYYFFWEMPKQESTKLDLERQRLELQKIELNNRQIIETQKIQIQNQVIEDEKTQIKTQKVLLDDCLKQAENVVISAYKDACPGFDSQQTVTCRPGAEKFIASAEDLRDQKVKECYQKYPQK